MLISIIVAVAEGNVIGYKNKLPWHIPADLRHFQKITTGHYLIMGQKTYESIGKPLPGRKLIILSNDPKYKNKDHYVARSIKLALNYAKESGEKEVMIAGGASIYKQFIDLADRIYLTKIHHKFKGDTCFPNINRYRWKVIQKEFGQRDEANRYDFEYLILEKQKK